MVVLKNRTLVVELLSNLEQMAVLDTSDVNIIWLTSSQLLIRDVLFTLEVNNNRPIHYDDGYLCKFLAKEIINYLHLLDLGLHDFVGTV